MKLAREIRFKRPRSFVKLVESKYPNMQNGSNTSNDVITATVINLLKTDIRIDHIMFSVFRQQCQVSHAKKKHSNLYNSDKDYTKVFNDIEKMFDFWIV